MCKPGGKIALASWTPDGYVGRMLGVVGKYVPAIAGLMPPICWGDERYLRLTFGDSIRSIQKYSAARRSSGLLRERIMWSSSGNIMGRR